YAQRIQGRQVLIENGDSYLLQRVPVSGYEQNEVHNQYDLHIEGTALAGQVSHLWKGENKENILFRANSVYKNKLQESLLQFLSHGNPNYVMTTVKQDG